MQNRPAAGSSSADRRVRHAVYRHFIETGGAPSARELAAALALAPSTVETSLHDLAAAHALVLRPGTSEVWMAHPFSAVPTAYPVRTPTRRYWANCAWDALGIPALLNTDAEVETTCPDCGDAVRLEVRDGALREAAGVVHFLVPAAHFWDDIGFT